MGGRLGHEGSVVPVSLGTYPQSPGTASPLRAASYSAIFFACVRACVCELRYRKCFIFPRRSAFNYHIFKIFAQCALTTVRVKLLREK